MIEIISRFSDAIAAGGLRPDGIIPDGEIHRIAAKRAEAMLTHSQPASPDRPYLTAKSVKPHGIRQQGSGLLIPIYVGNELPSMQSIFPNGDKRFLPGGRISGGCYLIPDETTNKLILIAEGFATGATLHERTGAACYVAFNANNLLPVARYVRAQHPHGDIIVCADNDAWTNGNPGVTRAMLAAMQKRQGSAR